MARKAAAWLLQGALPLVSACAFDAGGGFISLAPGELHASFEPEAARDLGEDQVLTDRGYRVQLLELTVHADEFALLEAGEAEASFNEVVHVPIDRELDLLQGDEVELTPYEPSAELGAGTLDRAELLVGRAAVSATVEGGPLEEPRSIEANVEVDAAIGAPLGLVLDREVPERIAPVVALHAGATLFDGIDFAALEDDEGIVEARLAEWLENAELVVDLGVAIEHEDEHEDEEEGHSH